ncbi:hypothetical protein HaLaN_02867, partial [Haematococcus lacustris]
QFGSSLTRLDVSGCGQVISDKGVQALATAAPNLRLLDLSCSAVTDKGIYPYYQRCVICNADRLKQRVINCSTSPNSTALSQLTRGSQWHPSTT